MPDAPAPPLPALDAAQRRLDAALARLERALAGRPLGDAALHTELEQARARERQLEQVAAEASAALGRAAAEVRAALAAEA